MQSWLPCFPRPKSWSSDFIRTDVFLKNEAIRELNKFSRVGALGGEGQCSMSGRKYLFDEHYHAVHGNGSPSNGSDCVKAANVCLSSVTRGGSQDYRCLLLVPFGRYKTLPLCKKVDGSMLPGKIGLVVWETLGVRKQNQAVLEQLVSLNSWSANRLDVTCHTVFHTGERFQLYLSCVWCFMHIAVTGLFELHNM